MKKLLTALFVLTATAQTWAQDQPFESATEAVRNMRLGWNLGNTLDSNSGDTLNMWIERWSDRSPKAYETAWGQPETKPELLKMMKEAGFNAVRVPVTWYPHMEAKFKLNGNVWHPSTDSIGTRIQAAWMQRVHEVVDYVISQDMYCILNVHHDTGEANTAWLIADMDNYALQHERFEALWRQIAEEFRDYDEHLLFEGYNEMLDAKRSWCFASFNASGQYDATIATSAYNAINAYAQSFVDAVRSTGGNNAERNLIVCTYGACCGSGTWNSHLQDPLKNMQLPIEPVGGDLQPPTQNHLIFEVHCYPDVSNLTNAKSEVRSIIGHLKNHLVSKGAPVIVGEWGTGGSNDYDERRANLLAFSRYFVEQTKQNDIATFHWMGLSDGPSRSVPEFNQPDRLEAIVKGYYGEEGYQNAITAPLSKQTDDAVVYTLSGQRVRPNHAGIYIKEGKKIMLK